MKILIKIENKSAELILTDKQKEVDKFVFPEERQLSERLLPEIDKLLKKNHVKPAQIEKMTVETDLGDNFTTTRIAKATANAWNWGKSVDK